MSAIYSGGRIIDYKKTLFDSLFPIKVTKEAIWIPGLIILFSLSRDTRQLSLILFKAGIETEWQNTFVRTVIYLKGTPISVPFGIPNLTNAD